MTVNNIPLPLALRRPAALCNQTISEFRAGARVIVREPVHVAREAPAPPTPEAWPFGEARPFGYNLIMADPPWLYELRSEKGEGKAPQSQYQCMSLDAIKALPVGHLAAQDCLLWLWATNPMLPEAIEVLKAWGFTYKTAGHWAKRTKNGKQAFGTGYILRCAGEPFIIGTIGNPVTARNVRSVIDGIVREHSRKPDEAYAEAEKLMPHAWRMDLFSRQRRPGWDNWGNEADKFDGVQA
jgi:N6-adenosine-specific RNA methylase IME4